MLFVMLMLLMFPVAAYAQWDPVVGSPNTTIPGGQLIYFFDLINNDVSYMSITNGGDVDVTLHITIFGDDCEEMVNFFIVVKRKCSRRFDLSSFEINETSTYGLSLVGMRGLILATPVATSRTGESVNFPYAIAFNHLTGSITLATSVSKASFGLNAIARPALQATMTTPGTIVYTPAPDGRIMTGPGAMPYTNPNTGGSPYVRYFYQRIAPTKLLLDHFFALNSVTDSRLDFINFGEAYGSAGDNYYYQFLPPAYTGTFSLFAETEDCALFSLPTRDYYCITDVPTATIVGAAAGYFRVFSGVLHITPKVPVPETENLFGYFFEKVGPYASGRPLWAERLPLPAAPAPYNPTN